MNRRMSFHRNHNPKRERGFLVYQSSLTLRVGCQTPTYEDPCKILDSGRAWEIARCLTTLGSSEHVDRPGYNRPST